MRSWDHEHHDIPYKKDDFRKLYFYPKKARVQKTQLGMLGCVAGTTDIMTFTLMNNIAQPAVCGKLTGQHSKNRHLHFFY
jgi:hypothetical protein